jgi:hypothetical protein
MEGLPSTSDPEGWEDGSATFTVTDKGQSGSTSNIPITRTPNGSSIPISKRMTMLILGRGDIE